MAKADEMAALSRAFKKYEEKGEVLTISKEVDSDRELAALVVEVDKLPYAPAVVFERVKGFKHRMGGNLFSERKRTCELLSMPSDPVGFKEAYIKAMENPLPPRIVSDGPCKGEVFTKNFDALKIVPSLKATEDCGGRYYQPIVITKDPVTGQRNMGVYRAMLIGENKVIINIRPETHIGIQFRRAVEKNIPFEVALILGASPEVYIAAVTKMPLGADETGLAGALRGKPLDLVKCESLDLEVPADAEFVIEGVVEPPYELATEGPWPEFLKYLSIPQKRPILRIKALSHSASPINYAVIAGTKENYNLRISNNVAFYKFVKALEPNFVVDATLTPGSAYWHHGVIKVRKDTPDREGLQINIALAAFGFSMYLETIIIVDHDVDILNMNEIDWAICTRCNPSEQLHILPEGRTHRNNPIAGVRELDPESFVGKAKLIIDATVPWRYRTVKRGELPLFDRARFKQLDLKDYLSSQDYQRWVAH